MMAITDDSGANWHASKPLLGFGNIQPTVLRRNNGTLVAYMRENGPRNKIRVCESNDDGVKLGGAWVSASFRILVPASTAFAWQAESGCWFTTIPPKVAIGLLFRYRPTKAKRGTLLGTWKTKRRARITIPR